ncbi:MAG TPA: TIGR01459 family HAD-type hydrolase [Rhizomicrobium sp.]|jgi:HAD superfamily hydrolase (TIGR01459 family)|nr:TIGR01459 family HAD-type hydrolase [Rhizomicrobium sp.]
MPLPQILAGLRETATDYDALVCDVWGVLHDGQAARPDAVDALRRFRETRGRVVLLSNAPRPKRDVETMFKRLGVALDCYDEIVTSGIAVRADLETRKPATMFHLGPERDRGIFEGLGIALTDIEQARIVLNSGLFDDDVETPDDYKDRLARMKARGLLMLCANPDWVVQRGGKLIWCAGALADEYRKIGGEVIYYGKPMTAIYDFVRAAAPNAKRMLAIGDGLHTDVKGANAAGIDALFIADGIHGEEIGAVTSEHMAELFAKAGVHARAAMRALVW